MCNVKLDKIPNQPYTWFVKKENKIIGVVGHRKPVKIYFPYTYHCAIQKNKKEEKKDYIYLPWNKGNIHYGDSIQECIEDI